MNRARKKLSNNNTYPALNCFDLGCGNNRHFIGSAARQRMHASLTKIIDLA